MDVEDLPWPKFLRFFHDNWKRGQHISCIAPTGAGKTTLIGGLLPLRRFVIAFDPKGGDSTLQATGFRRISSWPPAKRDYEEMAEGKPFRRILGPERPKHTDEDKIRENYGLALKEIYDEGNWTVFIPDLQLLTDPRFMGHGRQIEKQLIAARDRGVSLVTDFQRPSWVPRAASEMSTWVAVSYTRDRDVVGRLSEILGRPRAEVKGAIEAVPKHGWLFAGNDPREPYRVTIPSPLGHPRSQGTARVS